MPTTTITQLLGQGAARAPAIAAPERDAATYDDLRVLTEKTTAQLNALGIGRNDRVAIVLPNGPEMAAAFIAIAAGATTAPLNPGYRAEEFRFYLEDLGAKALLVEAGSKSPALAVAAELGIATYRLVVAPGAPAGMFTIEPLSAGDPDICAQPGLAEPDDIALVLHTSGTTSRPKIVPLSQANICASAGHIATTLQLGGTDRCLNVMPLFHIHGLLAAVTASLSAGGCVYCTPGFNALRFFAWLSDAAPSWYTAVPTMHQAILSRAPRNV
ncbi:MAG: AMP-binding protein, partial [Alphaproteobacteria bacterium]